MKYIKSITLLALTAILITSCGKKSNLGKLIPKEAAVVVDLNTKSLFSKLPWDEIKKTNWYSELMSDTSIPATSKAFLTDPAKTGIDMNADILFFALHPTDSGQIIVEGNLKDSKLFSDFIKSMHPDATANKDGELTIYTGKEGVIGWNAERFVMVANADQHHFHDENSLTDSAKNTIPLSPTTSQNLVTVCKNIFSLSKDNSLYENEKFAKLTDEEGDVHFWMNVNELSKGSMKGMPGMMGMVKLDKFLEDNISTATVNFRDGKITADHKQYFGKELSDILKSGDGNMNVEMIKRLPPNLAAVFSMHFTPSSMLEIIKLTGLDGFINLFMAQQGVTLDDVVKATRGDIVISAGNISFSKDTLDVKGINDSAKNIYHKPNATFLFAVAINNKDAFNKLVGLGDKMGKEESLKNIFKKSDDKYFVISNSQDAMNKYFSGTPSTPDFLSKINDHPVGGYVDFQMILKALQPEFTKDSTDQFYYNRNLSMWNNLYFSGGEFKNGGIVTNAELNLVDKTTNSLVQLNKYVDDNAKVMIENRKKHKGEWSNDSTVLRSTTDTVITKKTPHKIRK
jgi:hypothetical protein